MSTFPLHFLKGHLFLETGDAKWLIDTGAPTSFGSRSELALAGKHFRLGNDYHGHTVADLSPHVGACAGLLGNDVLGQFDMLLDVPNRTVELSVEELRHPGQSVKLDEFMGIPIVTTRIRGADYRMFFDTGAQLSYLQLVSLSDFPPAGVITDFYLEFGTFETETHIVDIQLGEIDFSLRCGTLPVSLRDRFMMTGTADIVGNEIVRTRQVGYFPRRRLLVL